MKRYFMLSIIVLLTTVCTLFGGEIKYDILYQTGIPRGLSEKGIAEIVDNALQWKENGNPYSQARIKVFSNNEALDYLVVYMFRADIYLAECYKIEIRRNNTYSVVNNYTEEPDPEEDEACQTCPDETVEIVVSTSETGSSHPANEYVNKAFDDLDAAGVKVVELYGSEESNSAIKDWLSCKNLKLWGRIGHGVTNGTIMLGSGSLKPSEVSQMDLHHKFMIINSCFVHNQAMIPNMIEDADAYFFCSGDNASLPMYSSEPVWRNIIKKGVLEGVEFGKAVEDAGQEGNMTLYGYTRNPDANGECFWSDVTSWTLGLDSPNGGGEYVVTSSVDITWTTNADTKISLYLLKGSNVVETIVEDTENDGVHTWVIPEDTEEGSDYKVRAKTDTLVDESDETFTIKQKPSIVVKDTELSAEVDTSGTSKEVTLNIANEGKGSLLYSISRAGGSNNIMINELFLPETDFFDGFELWNRGTDIDMSGWKVEWNDNQNTSGEYSFPDDFVFKSGETIVFTDEEDMANGTDLLYPGDNLYWDAGEAELSIALLDADGKGVDFVRSSGNSDEPPEGTEWNGSGVELSSERVYRNGNDDNDDASDWDGGSGESSVNTINPGQTMDGVGVYWLSCSQEEGTVDPNKDVDIKVIFSGKGLAIGEYYDTLLIAHDDPDNNSPVLVMCKLTVSAITGLKLAAGNKIDTYGIRWVGPMILYHIPERGNGKQVSVKLYNLKGELVRVLANRIHTSGLYRIALNNKEKELAAGSYICHIKTNGFKKAINVLLR